MNEKTRLHAWIRGDVHGVGFRYFVRQRAATLQAAGWVRNLTDGRVELIAEGSPADLNTLLAAVKQGPRGSQVTDVKTEWGTASGEYQSFTVKPTA